MSQPDLFATPDERRLYVVYDPQGQQVGHVSVWDLDQERERHPGYRYELSRFNPSDSKEPTHTLIPRDGGER